MTQPGEEVMLWTLENPEQSDFLSVHDYAYDDAEFIAKFDVERLRKIFAKL